MDLYPELVEQTLFVATYTRGVREDLRRGEETDKIIHELRLMSLLSDDKREEMQPIFERLRKWSNAKDDEPVEIVAYYGREDPTLTFPIVTNNYEKTYPDRARAFLYTPVPHIEDKTDTVTVREATYNAIRRITRKLSAFPGTFSNLSDKGNVYLPKFFAYKRGEETGLPHAVWTDSNFPVLREDGTPVNTDDWIVHTQLQGLAITALISGAELKRREADWLSEGPEKQQLLDEASEWENLAFELHNAFDAYLWDEETNFPFWGLERNEQGNLVPIRMQTTIAIELLRGVYFDKRFWKGREEQRLERIKGIVDRVTDPDQFLTDAGPTIVALKYEDIIKKLGYIPYHWMPWPRNVKEGIDGFRTLGLHKSALALSYLLRRNIAIHQAVHQDIYNTCDYFPELTYINPDTKRGIYNSSQKTEELNAQEGVVLAETNIPVAWLTMSASASKAEDSYVSQFEYNETFEPIYEFSEIQAMDEEISNKLLAYIESLPSIEEEREYAIQHPVFIDTKAGARAEIFHLLKHGIPTPLIENAVKEGIVTWEEVSEYIK